MFGMIDLLTVALIEKKFKEYQNCPDRIEFALCGLINQKLFRNMVGDSYVKEAVDFITNVKLNIQPYYSLDQQQDYSISVISSGSESQKFIGDHGFDMIASNEPYSHRFAPVVIAKFTASSIDKNMMSVPPELRLDEKLYPGVIITNGTHSAVVDGIVDASNICLKTDIPDGTSPEGWRAQTAGSNKIYTVNSSIDTASVQCLLTTHGEPGNHRLLSVILRMILKSCRLEFDSLGYQDIRMSYTPMTVSDQDHIRFETVYSIEGKAPDHWIVSTNQSTDPGGNIEMQTVADNKKPGGKIIL